MTEHRVTCEQCGTRTRARIWRESCVDCAQDTADRHRRETGHAVELSVTQTSVSMWELQQMTRRAHMVLYSPKRGW